MLKVPFTMSDSTKSSRFSCVGMQEYWDFAHTGHMKHPQNSFTSSCDLSKCGLLENLPLLLGAAFGLGEHLGQACVINTCLIEDYLGKETL